MLTQFDPGQGERFRAGKRFRRSTISVVFFSVIALSDCASSPQPVSKIAVTSDSKESIPPAISGVDRCMQLVTALSRMGRSISSVLGSQKEVLATSQAGGSHDGISKARALASNCLRAGRAAKDVLAATAGFGTNPAAGEIREWAGSVSTLMDQMQKTATAAADIEDVGSLRSFWISPKGRTVSATLVAGQQKASEASLKCMTGQWEWNPKLAGREQRAQ